MAPPGLTALGAKGSVRDRLTPPGRVEGSALGSYEAPLRWRCGRPYGRHFLYRPAGVGKQANLAPLEEMHSPFGGWRHHLSPSMRGHYKAPLCCELLMKGLLFRALLSHRSAVAREHDS